VVCIVVCKSLFFLVILKFALTWLFSVAKLLCVPFMHFASSVVKSLTTTDTKRTQEKHDQHRLALVVSSTERECKGKIVQERILIRR